MSFMVLTRSQAINSTWHSRSMACRPPVYRLFRHVRIGTSSSSSSSSSPSRPCRAQQKRHYDTSRRRGRRQNSRTVFDPSTLAASLVDDEDEPSQPIAAQPGPSNPPSAQPGTYLYAITELMLQIATHSDWLTLMALSRTNRDARRWVQSVVKDRIHAIVEPFFSSGCCDTVMNTLDRIDGVIVGSVARRLLTMNSEWWLGACACLAAGDFNPFAFSYDLNIILPSGSVNEALKSLEDAGYDGPNLRPLTVTVSESTSVSVLPIVLAAPVTSQLHVLSPSRVYSFFPSFATSNRAIRTDYMPLRPSRKSQAYLDVRQDNRSWKSPCGCHCPARVRKTIKDSTVAIYRWNVSINDHAGDGYSTDYLLTRESIQDSFHTIQQFVFAFCTAPAVQDLYLNVDDYVDRPGVSHGGVVRMNQGYKNLQVFGECHRYTIVSSEGSMAPLRANRFLLQRIEERIAGKDGVTEDGPLGI
ncbi:hypothetical protein BKA70DRAFT_1433966 [Coprinopsis sp. MPI-PUGE-AT-0042]|nr:hypothetical protein BKA70DRAFT_1433966 [Coprinopsis sp. MPI-PUGE-AT-0042]